MYGTILFIYHANHLGPAEVRYDSDDDCEDGNDRCDIKHGLHFSFVFNP